MKTSILIIEDEERIAHWLQRYFERDGFKTALAADGTSGLEMARKWQPDLIVLDLMLPGIDGMTICRTLRSESEVPILMLTARSGLEDRVKGLNIGADDYVVKPFDPEEVVARARAILRRVKGTLQPILRAGDIEINQDMYQVKVNGKVVALSRSLFTLLVTFMRHPNQVLSRNQLIDAIAGDDFDANDRAIDTQIRRLRRQIELDTRKPRYIQTVYGVGYKFATLRDD